MLLDLNQRLAPCPDVVSQLLPSEAVLLLPARGEVKVLNDVGARIWSLLDGRCSLGEIVATVHAEYDVDRSQAEHDVIRFVSELVQREMVMLRLAHP